MHRGGSRARAEGLLGGKQHHLCIKKRRPDPNPGNHSLAGEGDATPGKGKAARKWASMVVPARKVTNRASSNWRLRPKPKARKRLLLEPTATSYTGAKKKQATKPLAKKRHHGKELEDILELAKKTARC